MIVPTQFIIQINSKTLISYLFIGQKYEVICDKKTWEEAKTNCSNANATLLDFTDAKDLQYLNNISVKEIWIGLRKNRSYHPQNLTNASDLLKISRCELVNISGNTSRKNVSCEVLLLSVCTKTGTFGHV